MTLRGDSKLSSFGKTIIVAVAVMAVAMLASGQFLQPQSHLGRIMQTFTSPIVIHQGGEPGPESSPGPEHQPGASAARYYASSGRPDAGEDEGASEGRVGGHRNGMRLQQAPSQQRGSPAHQQYYDSAGVEGANRYDTGPDELDEARAPSRHHQQHAGEGQGGGDSFQMGAYLGPSMDDKEINGAFGSSANGGDDRDDERDSYDGGPSSSGPAHSAASRGRPTTYEGGASQSGGYNGPSNNYGGHQGAAPSSYDDESSADEDEPRDDVRPTRGQGRGAAPLRQAASQQRHRGERARQGMMAAAANGGPNGYNSYGPPGGGYTTNGPVDLTGMLSGGFGDPSGGYYGAGGPAGYGPPGNQGYGQGGNGRQFDRDNDNDDDNDDDRRGRA